MKNKVLLLLLALLLAVPTFAEPHPRNNPFEILDLTAAQQTQLRELREALREKLEPLRNQQRVNRDAIEAALDAGDATAAGTAMLANHKLRAQMKAAHESFAASFSAILTAGQREKFEVLRELREARRDGRPRARRRPR